MKKFKLWHLAVIAIAVFFVFAAIVAVIAVNNESLHNADRWRIGWDDINWNFGWGNWNDNDWDLGWGIGEEYTIDESDTVDLSGKTKISLYAISADINIYQSNDDTLDVRLYGNYASRNKKIELDVQTSGSTVRVEVKYPKNSGVNRSDLTLDIYIPKGYDKDLSVSGVSSDIVFDCDDMKFDDITINNVSGDTETDTLHTDRLFIGTVSGKVTGEFPNSSIKVNSVSAKVNLTDISGTVDIDTVSGDITLYVIALDDMQIDTVSGDVTIYLEKESDFYVDFESVSGDFECDIPIMVIRQKGADFEGYVGERNAPELQVDSVSGDLTIIN